MIAAEHAQGGGVSLGRHSLVSCFMCGMRCLRTFWPACVHSCDISIVLEGLPSLLWNHFSQLQISFWLSSQSCCWRLHPLKGLWVYRLSVSLCCMDFVFVLWKFWSKGRLLLLRHLPKVTSFWGHLCDGRMFLPTFLSDFIIWTLIWLCFLGFICLNICQFMFLYKSVYVFTSWWTGSHKVWQCGISVMSVTLGP